MNKITVDKSVLLSEDFSQDFEEKLCAYLNSLIDAELEKNDEADFDLIDEYAAAINDIRKNGTSEFVSVISESDSVTKASSKASVFFKALAACAAVAVIIAGVFITANNHNSEIVKAAAERFRKIFNHNTITYTQPEPTSETDETTQAQEIINGIGLEFDESFKTDYYVGEDFSTEGLKVYVITTKGKKEIDNYSVKVPENFSEKACEQSVTVSAMGFSKSFKIRVLNSKSTPILNSIYATFPEGYDFTYHGEPELSQMRVFAVYSTGNEKELTPDEYIVTIEKSRQIFKEKAQVNIEYEGCNCAFILEEVLN